MPTRKQRRRAQKERRHEYETVWVDDEGNELEEPPEDAVAPLAGPRREEEEDAPACGAPYGPSLVRLEVEELAGAGLHGFVAGLDHDAAFDDEEHRRLLDLVHAERLAAVEVDEYDAGLA